MAVLNALLEITVYSFILYGGIRLFGWLFKGKLSAQLKYALWFLLVLRLVLPVTLASPVHLLSVPREAAAAPAQVHSAGGDIARHDASASGSASVSDPAIAGDRALAPADTAPAGRIATPSPVRIGWPGVLLGVWLAGMAGMLLCFSVLSFRMRRRIRRECIDTPDSLKSLMDNLCQGMGLRGRPEMLITQGDGSPCLTASVRPRLLLPAALLTRFDRRQLAFAIGHELTHYRRRDYLAGLLLNLLRCVYWFNPVVWLAARDMQADMESACDGDMIGALGDADRKRYAQTLLALFSRGGRRGLALGMAEGNARAAAERRIRGIFSKRKSCRGARWAAAALALVMLFACFTTACQPTPEKGIVAEKDTERMLEQAQKAPSAANGGRNLSEQYGIPESYQFEAKGADGNLNIHVDAAVTVPEGSAMPIYRVKSAEFSQETVNAFWKVLCGDAEMWIHSGQRTKDQIRQTILLFQKRNVEIKDDPQSADELAANEQMLAQCEKELETAPDTLVEERTDGALVHTGDTTSPSSAEEGDAPAATPIPVEQGGGTGTGLDAYERYNGGTGRTFYVNNNSSATTITTMLYCDFRNPAANNHFGISPSLPVREDSDVDAESLSKVGLKPSEAKQTVQELLDKTGLGMVVDRMYLQDDTKYYDNGTVQPAEHYVYLIYCVRTVDGLPCSYAAGYSSQEDDAVAPYWQYEEMYFLVNSEGVFEMSWTAPIEIVETVNTDAQLKSFSEIREIFEKMMLVKYEPEAKNSKEDFEINHVTLSLHRIIEKNSNESGLLVPAWNFYGKWITGFTVWDDPNGQASAHIETLNQSFLTINAIDGSVIDRSIGY